jgi:hypothetical protein
VEGLEILLSDLSEELFDPATVVDGLADRVVEGLGDIGADLPAARASVEIEGRMLLPASASAVGLATAAESHHQRAPEHGFVGEELSGARACLAFLTGALSPRSHRGLLF